MWTWAHTGSLQPNFRTGHTALCLCKDVSTSLMYSRWEAIGWNSKNRNNSRAWGHNWPATALNLSGCLMWHYFNKRGSRKLGTPRCRSRSAHMWTCCPHDISIVISRHTFVWHIKWWNVDKLFYIDFIERPPYDLLYIFIWRFDQA